MINVVICIYLGIRKYKRWIHPVSFNKWIFCIPMAFESLNYFKERHWRHHKKSERHLAGKIRGGELRRTLKEENISNCTKRGHLEWNLGQSPMGYCYISINWTKFHCKSIYGQLFFFKDSYFLLISDSSRNIFYIGYSLWFFFY